MPTPDEHEPAPAARDDEAAEALKQTGYTYTDPVDDPQWQRIAAPDDDAPDAFPAGWSATPTERDQAAIEAGNR